MYKQRFSTAPLCLAVLLCAFVSCKQTRKTRIHAEYSPYISAFTSGTISREAVVRVRLATDVAKENEINAAVDKKIFEFSPALEGTAVWTDKSTLEFRPKEKMKQGQIYQVTFLLSKVLIVPKKFSEFEFDFQVIPQSFEVNVEGLKPLNNKNFDRQILSGTLNTADVEDGEKVEKLLTAWQNKKALPVRWLHQSDRKVHAFEVDSILRAEDSGSGIYI